MRGETLSSTPAPAELVHRARLGDRDAQDSVFGACVAPLSRLAHTLLPAYARGMTDTQDVVQDVLTSTARRLASIDCPNDGALLAYLRQAVRHRVLDEIRRATRRPPMGELGDDCPSPGLSPLDVAIRAQNDQQVRAALRQLTVRDRRVIVLRLQHRLSYEEIGERMGLPTSNAARVAVSRAVARLGRVLAASRTLGPGAPTASAGRVPATL